MPDGRAGAVFSLLDEITKRCPLRGDERPDMRRRGAHFMSSCSDRSTCASGGVHRTSSLFSFFCEMESRCVPMPFSYTAHAIHSFFLDVCFCSDVFFVVYCFFF